MVQAAPSQANMERLKRDEEESSVQQALRRTPEGLKYADVLIARLAEKSMNLAVLDGAALYREQGRVLELRERIEAILGADEVHSRVLLAISQNVRALQARSRAFSTGR